VSWAGSHGRGTAGDGSGGRGVDSAGGPLLLLLFTDRNSGRRSGKCQQRGTISLHLEYLGDLRVIK
jgi:hypothetical protein